jgi:hypothetical protein
VGRPAVVPYWPVPLQVPTGVEFVVLVVSSLLLQDEIKNIIASAGISINRFFFIIFVLTVNEMYAHLVLNKHHTTAGLYG